MMVVFAIGLPIAFSTDIKNTFLYNTRDMVDVYDMYAYEFKKDQVVSADFYFIFDCVAEEYTTENGRRTHTNSQYYLVPVGTEEFMIVNVPAKKFAEFDKLVDESWEYYTDETAPLPQTVYIEGRMDKLDSEIKGYLYEYFIATDFLGTDDTAEMDAYIVPYMMTYADWKSSATTATVVLIISAILIAITVIVIITTIKKSRAAKAFNEEYPPLANMSVGGNLPPMGDNLPPVNGSYQPQNSYSYQPADTATSSAPDLTSPYAPQNDYYAGMDSLSSTTYDENQKPPCEL